MKLVVIIPTYNERENIITLLSKLREVLKTVKGYSVSYLVVDDNSPDGTAAEVAAYQKKYTDVHILTGQKQGLGKALLRGMTYAVDVLGAEALLQMDADLSHDPHAVPDFLEAIKGKADFAVGSRYIRGGSIPGNWGLHRKIFSKCANSIVRFGLWHMDVHDWTGGFRVYTKRFYDEIHDEMGKYSGYLFQIAFLHKAIHHGAIIHEVPIHFTDRLYGDRRFLRQNTLKVYSYI
jgi:dolichol-phosphate mannosyltransferase